VPATKPNVANIPLNNLSVADCEWVAGFTSEEGHFKIGIKVSARSKVGFQTFIGLYIAQHVRDEVLMRSFIDFFGCGHYSIRSSNKEGGDFYCVSFADICQKIIPFFKKHTIRGIKSLDFDDWCKVAELMERGVHKTPEGLATIRKVKDGMNRGREW
jgi:LAGLIDADG endonuclease